MWCLSLGLGGLGCSGLGASYSNMEDMSIGKMLFGYVIKSGYCESDVCIRCSLIDMFAKDSGDMISAYKVFEKMSQKNSFTIRNVSHGLVLSLL